MKITGIHSQQVVESTLRWEENARDKIRHHEAKLQQNGVDTRTQLKVVANRITTLSCFDPRFWTRK